MKDYFLADAVLAAVAIDDGEASDFAAGSFLVISGPSAGEGGFEVFVVIGDAVAVAVDEDVFVDSVISDIAEGLAEIEFDLGAGAGEIKNAVGGGFWRGI